MTVAAVIPLGGEALDRLMPMHVIVGPRGRIRRAGPTLSKLARGEALEGRAITELCELRRPRQVEDLREVLARSAARIHLRLLDADRTQLVGTAVRLPGEAGTLVNLSFGISVIEAVARFDLSASDFAPTDLTMELLYLFEAKSAAMDASRRMNDKLHGARIAAEAEALSDELTGLANRRALEQALGRLVARGRAFTLMHLDLDFFKAVNDSLGHAAGDEVLREVARILLDETRGDDTVARVGGDEFVIIFNGLTNEDKLAATAGRMIRRLEAPIRYGARDCTVSASIGMVPSTGYEAPTLDRMLRDADAALYASKGAGRARYTIFGSAPVPAPEGAVLGSGDAPR